MAIFREGVWGSRWSQDGTKSLQKSIPKSIKKMINFWIAPTSIFDRFWAPTWGVQGGPFVVCRATFSPLEHLLEPRCAKDPPRSPKTPARRLLGAIVEDFDPQHVGFWKDFGTLLARFWHGLVPTTQPTHQSTKQPTNQPTNQTSRRPDISTSQARGRLPKAPI